MKDETVRMGPRERQIAELLLQGCDNAEIARQLKMARRTVKAHFNRLFLRFGISGGIKRVKLATLLYRRQICSEANATVNESPVNENNESSNSLLKDSRTAKLHAKSEPPNTSSRITFASSTTSSDSGTGSNSPSGTKADDSTKQSDRLESWEHSIMGLGETGARNRRLYEH